MFWTDIYFWCNQSLYKASGVTTELHLHLHIFICFYRASRLYQVATHLSDFKQELYILYFFLRAGYTILLFCFEPAHEENTFVAPINYDKI
jgi:hypothetical protein